MLVMWTAIGSLLVLVLAMGATSDDSNSVSCNNTLGELNYLLSVTKYSPFQLLPFFSEYFVARSMFQECSIRDIYAGLYVSSTKLRLYYGSEPDDYVAVTVGSGKTLLDDPHYDASRCLAIYVFGYDNSPETSYTRYVIEAALTAERYNVLLVDWSGGSSQDYSVAVDLAEGMAAGIAQDLFDMVDLGACLERISGSGVGGQAIGAISRELRALGGSMPCAISLDPARALYKGFLFGCGDTLQKDDADNVIILHSDICGLGNPDTSGKVHIFLNNGLHRQPECPDDSYDLLGSPVGDCSHRRALVVFANALSSGIFARQCDSWEEYKEGQCSENEVIMFPDCSAGEGTYYIDTSME